MMYHPKITTRRFERRRRGCREKLSCREGWGERYLFYEIKNAKRKFNLHNRRAARQFSAYFTSHRLSTTLTTQTRSIAKNLAPLRRLLKLVEGFFQGRGKLFGWQESAEAHLCPRRMPPRDLALPERFWPPLPPKLRKPMPGHGHSMPIHVHRHSMPIHVHGHSA